MMRSFARSAVLAALALTASASFASSAHAEPRAAGAASSNAAVAGRAAPSPLRYRTLEKMLRRFSRQPATVTVRTVRVAEL
jgi:hypothetical protein